MGAGWSRILIDFEIYRPGSSNRADMQSATIRSRWWSLSVLLRARYRAGQSVLLQGSASVEFGVLTVSASGRRSLAIWRLLRVVFFDSCLLSCTIRISSLCLTITHNTARGLSLIDLTGRWRTDLNRCNFLPSAALRNIERWESCCCSEWL
jgi:hypothetical protein